MTTSEEMMPAPPVRHWPALNLTGPAFDPLLSELMEEGPLTRIQLPHGEGWAWLVTRHDDVRMVTQDPRFSRAELVGRQVTRLAAHVVPNAGAMHFADGPDHARLRKAVAPALCPQGVERLRAHARRTLVTLVDEMLRHGPPADLLDRILAPFADAVVCELMGVPAADRVQTRTWTRLLLSSPDAGAGERAGRSMAAYFAKLVAERRDSDGEDIVSRLGAAVGRGDLTKEDATALAGTIQAGGAAVTHTTGQMFYVLLTRPALFECLRTEPALRPRAVEELLRHIPHRNSVGLPRIATEDVVLHGVRISAGDPVYVSYLAANRDPDVFPDPERIDFDRTPNPHLAFGHGTHHCAGAELARLETNLLVNTLTDSVPTLRLAVPPDEVPWHRGTVLRGPERLPVTW